MPIQYQLLREKELIVGYAWGNITSKNVTDGLLQLSSLPGFRAGLDRFVEFDGSSCLSDFDFEGLKKIKQTSLNSELVSAYRTSKIEKPKYKLAVVCSATLRDVVFRLYQALWDAEEAAKVEVAVFDQKFEALDWLGHPCLRVPDARPDIHPT